MTTTDHTGHTLEDLYAICVDERREQRSESSPGCVELFRRAFAGDERAWALASALFEPLMRSWAGVQPYVEQADVLQEALLQFWRFAPQRTGLVETQDIRPLLAYLRKVVKTTLIGQLRRQVRMPGLGAGAEAGAELADERAFESEIELRVLLDDYALRLVKTPQERLIFRLHFSCALKPQEILARHPNLFSDTASIYSIIQRLARRLRAALRDHVDAYI